MHITKIDPFGLPPSLVFDIDCDEQVNLLIGSNASGKSTILRAIKVLHSRADDADGVVQTDPEGSSYIFNTFVMSASDDWPRDESGGARWSEVPVLYIPATRISLPVALIFAGRIIKRPQNLESEAPLKHLFDTEPGIFDGRYVELAIDSLREGMVGDHDKQWRLNGVLQHSYSCAQSICSEVLTVYAPRPYVDEDEISATPRSLVHFGMGIETSDNTYGERLYAGDLSSGTQGTLLWIYALALQMASHYGWAEGWENKPAILLIDEIENHLHPTWQRRVIPALLEHFPGLQIFATTHSPFVVAGLKTGQVHLLNRDENGVVTATTNTEDIVGWTADEILRNMMGVDDPTDQLTVDRMNRLRQLRALESLTPEEESELNELRRQVNEDLLSKGGPLEAQRERYGELMERFLRSRQSELSQDGD